MINTLKNKNILLVEDELDIQNYFKETLEFFFSNIYTASNGQEALEIYYNENIDVIFTDYSMPIMDGYEFILKIRKINKQIPIVIISNHDDRDKLQKCITLGLSGYLFKPLDYNQIKKFLESFSKELIDNNSLDFKISDNCYINLSQARLTTGKFNHTITQLESEFLNLMIENVNRIVTYDTMINALYKYNLNSVSIKNIVYRLKTKYKFDNIKNIINVGYILVTDEK